MNPFRLSITRASTALAIIAGAGNIHVSASGSGVQTAASLMPDSVTTLDEFNVVALKQEEAIRREAVAATVVAGAETEMLNVSAMKGISDVVPNFYVPDYGSRITSSMYVRGIGARMDQPAVGLNVDNVPYLNKNAYDFDLADIASVEMLRGPQSTLYGRNTIGGLISIATLSPMRWQGWRAMVSAATANEWKASLGWYHKFNPKLATSISGNFSYLGGFFRNEYTGRRLDHEKSGALRWKLEANPSASLSIRNVTAASILRQGGYPYEYVGTGSISYNDPCFYHRFNFTDGLTLNYRAEKFTMTSITSVQYIDDNMTLDQDFLPESYFTLTQKQNEVGLTEDLVFRGGGGDHPYSWTAGAFGFFKHLDMEAPVTFKDRGIASLIESHRNEANPTYPISWDSREFPLLSDFKIPTGGVALYHRSTYRAGAWTFNLGLRLDWERSVMDYRSRCNTGYTIGQLQSDGSVTPFRHADIDIDEKGSISRDFFNWMPSLGIVWNLPLEGENNLYANISKGYKAGGFNTQMFSDVLQQRLMGLMGMGAAYDVDKIVAYKPEYSWNYELGTHLSFPAARLDLDVSAFYIDCHDQQLTMFPDGTTTGRIMTNAGRTRSFGAEVAVNWSPVKRLDISLAYGYTNARFLEFHDGIDDYKGKYVPYAPSNTLFTMVSYAIPVRLGAVHTLSVEADVRGTGPIYWNEDNSLRQNFYALLGASVTLEARKWSLQFWGKNLTDTRFHTFYFMSMGNEFLQQGRPVQGGVTFRIEI